jgi:ubiquinone/menaquinone biosynthesis C-methylase UbiE
MVWLYDVYMAFVLFAVKNINLVLKVHARVCTSNVRALLIVSLARGAIRHGNAIQRIIFKGESDHDYYI